ncbi:MAG TPA: DUF3035 domain-containing protein [Azospirillaceae bacterium]|nr:DUF3035 domain-containing protein [Azospirillaceae bacterium]
MGEISKVIRAAGKCGLLLAGLAALSGCDSVGRALGIERAAPDEFRVVSRAPLEVPPDFNLRPPQPGSPRPQELAQDTRSTASVFGAAGTGVAGGQAVPGAAAGRQSTGEVALVQQAGADQADSDIRAIVDRESPGVVVGDRGLLDRLMFWKDDLPPAQTQHQGGPPVISRQGSTQTQ